MNKTFGSACLVAGTAIGAGVIALPLTIAKLGILPAVLLMVGVWLFMHMSSLINLELNLRASKGLSLGELGAFYSGKGAKLIGSLSLMLLIYSLLSAYFYAGTSIIQNFLGIHHFHKALPYLVGIVSAIFLLNTAWVDKLNRILFIGLIITFIAIIIGLVSKVEIVSLPLVEHTITHLSSWSVAIPVLFTSFGFQVIFHTLTKYCDRNPVVLKRAFFYGSLIALVVYVSWTASIMAVLYDLSPAFYDKVLHGGADVGELIKVLSSSTHWVQIQILFWIISLLAILTSILGVGLGLIDIWKEIFDPEHNKGYKVHVLALLLTVLPAYIVASLVPKAFIAALAFAGMVLVVIAILLPVWLLKQSETKDNYMLYYPIVKSKFLVRLLVIFGLFIIACELFNLF